jgi:D-alanyl-D-alanine carboxypeptidase
MKYLFGLFTLCTAHLVARTQDLDQVIRFIKDNPKKSSVYLMDNGQLTIDYNSSQLMPLESAAKTIIAIEFSKQAAKQIDASQKVPVKDIAVYYVRNTDGGAFPNWLKQLFLCVKS